MYRKNPHKSLSNLYNAGIDIYLLPHSLVEFHDTIHTYIIACEKRSSVYVLRRHNP